ncbi:YjcZ family sporulation protein [Bacillus songklensis]|uniref:YjcZ family sporulation protein n=1 Tax=Bacillus songklensis TaxID=1069116 RepID=A0ABV8B465_9BACI
MGFFGGYGYGYPGYGYGGAGYGGCGYGGGFALIVVLFILLIIVGAVIWS